MHTQALMFSQTGTDVLPRRDEGSDKQPTFGDTLQEITLLKLANYNFLLFP